MQDNYHHYFQRMPCYLTVVNSEHRLIEANERFSQHFGNWQGRRCHQVYKNESEPCETCPVERTFFDGECHSEECTIVSLDGRQHSVLIYTSPIFNGSGEVQSVLKMSTDITSLSRRTSQIRDSQRRFRQIFEEVPCYISIQDPDLHIVDANRRFNEDFGAFLGCKCYEIYKHRDEECLICPVQRTFQDGRIHSSEEVVTSREGKQMHVLVYTSPIFDSMGMISRVMEMGTDITPVRELQSRLESIGLIIGSLSHGIKGLLNGLDGGMYLVNTGMKKGDTGRLEKGWEMVQRNVDRIRSQVLNILYYAKEREPEWELIQGRPIAEEVFALMHSKAVELGIELLLDVDDALGDFEADMEAIRSLLINLVENSLDACRVDKEKTEHQVAISARGEEDSVRFEITDNGIGMDRETMEKAFSLFFSSKGAKGTGLGLFIANKIATAHGGYLDLHSERGLGTSFAVILPRKRKKTELEEPND